MARSLLQRYGGQSCVNSATNVSRTSLHSEQIMYRVIKSCAKVTAHKPKQIPLLQTLTPRTWNFDSRKSSGQISAEAMLESSVTGDQFYLGFSCQHCHLPQPAGRAGRRARREAPSPAGVLPPRDSASPPPPPGITTEMLFRKAFARHCAAGSDSCRQGFLEEKYMSLHNARHAARLSPRPRPAACLLRWVFPAAARPRCKPYCLTTPT